MEEGASREGKSGSVRYSVGRTGGLEPRLVEVGLKASFEDVKRRGKYCGGHASKAANEIRRNFPTLKGELRTRRRRNAPMVCWS